MNSNINKKANAKDMWKEDELWEDPMCYPAYDTTNLIERHGTVCKERNTGTSEISAHRVAA